MVKRGKICYGWIFCILICLLLAGCKRGALEETKGENTEQNYLIKEEIIKEEPVSQEPKSDSLEETSMTAEAAELNTQEEIEEEEDMVYRQLSLIAQNRQLWLEDYESLGYIVHYAVTDLDQNGRYEIIISGMGGTGLYTTSRIFEVNESLDGITECITDFLEGSEPDLVEEVWERYLDENFLPHYVVEDITRNGMYGAFLATMELVMEEGKISTNYLAGKETIAGENQEDDYTLIFTDSAGNVISEEEYNNIVADYFAGYEREEKKIGWQDVTELKESTEEIILQLEQSFFAL